MQVSETPPPGEIDPNQNVSDLLASRVSETPDQPLFGVPDGDGWRDVTSREFEDQVKAIAKGLIASGLEPGERVAFIGITSYEWTLIDFALFYAGLVMVPVYETSSAKQLEWMLDNSDAVGVITHQKEHTELGDAASESRNAVRFRCALDEGDLTALIEKGKSISDEEVEKRRSLANHDDMATIIYTSGSTGQPKGCVITHGNFIEISRAMGVTHTDMLEAEGGASTLMFVTLAHVLARLVSILCVYNGIKVGHEPNTKNLMQAMQTFKPTFLLVVPRVFEKIYNGAEAKAESAGRGKLFRRAAKIAVRYSQSMDTGRTPLHLKMQHALYDRFVFSKIREGLGGRVEYAVCGSAPLTVYLTHFFRTVGVKVMEGYGLTETTAPLTVDRTRGQKFGTVGLPLPGCAVKIAEDGEILGRGVGTFKGYWKNDELTNEVFDADGWFHTGDLGELDEEGFLTVTGRKKDIIVTAGGKNVSPSVLEDPIRANPIVSEVVVVGDQRPFVAAIMTLDEESLGQWLTNNGEDGSMSVAEAAQNPKVLAEIQSAVDEANTRVSRAESIRKFVVLDTQFSFDDGTLTPKMSIKRGNVLKKYAPVIDGIYNAAPPTTGISLK